MGWGGVGLGEVWWGVVCGQQSRSRSRKHARARARASTHIDRTIIATRVHGDRTVSKKADRTIRKAD